MICLDHQNGCSGNFFPNQPRGMPKVGDPSEAARRIEQVFSTPFQVKAYGIVCIVRNAERMNPEVLESEWFSSLENLPTGSVLQGCLNRLGRISICVDRDVRLL